MAEIQKLVEDELSKVGRVVLLADVCRAHRRSAISRPRAIGSVVEKLGEAPGEMLGLMACASERTFASRVRSLAAATALSLTR